MSLDWTLDELELERYEQWEGAPYRFELGRRDFIRSLGGGLLVALVVGEPDAQAAPGSGRRRRRGPELPKQLAAWIRIGPDESVTVYTGKVEVGQGIRTSLAQAVAEELDVPVERIRMVMGDTALTPYDRGTHGSRSTPAMGRQLHQVAASTRSALIGLAADRWKAKREGLTVRNGSVIDADGRSSTFGALAKGRNLVAVVDEAAAVRPAARWRRAGKSVPRVDARALVTGEHQFVSDLQLPGLQHGRVLRAPSFGAKLRDVDTSAARAIPGVTVVHDGEFVGVVAGDPAIAERAIASVKASWQEKQHPSSAELFEYLESHPVDRKGWRGGREHTAGKPDARFRRARHRLEARYHVPYIAHAPLEPRAAVAQWVGDRVVVWAGTQHPFSVRDAVANAFGLAKSQARVRVPDTGSGYGGKHTPETAIEAARLARAVSSPVKVVWTREEEFTWAYFRPAGVIDVRSAVNRAGKLTAWEHVNYNSGGSAIDTPYDVPNKRLRFQPCDSPARQGSYRALASTANCFARESHMDEIASKLGVDPLELRRRHLSDDRMRAVLEAAAERFGWSKRTKAKGIGAGLAVGFDKGGYVSTCAEVRVHGSGKLEVTRLVTAFECGAIVNPDNLVNQIEGAVIMGLGGALFEAIDLAGGKVLNARFSQYRVPRFSDLGSIETVLVDRRDLPSAGAGEAPIICVAPAVANAIFAATRKRIRSLPLARDGRIV